MLWLVPTEEEAHGLHVPDLAGSWDLEWWDGEEQRGIQLCIA